MSGTVDTGDTLWQQFTLTDGHANTFLDGATTVTNLNVPGDTDAVARPIPRASRGLTVFAKKRRPQK